MIRPTTEPRVCFSICASSQQPAAGCGIMNRPAQKQSSKQQKDIVNGPSGTAFWAPTWVKGLTSVIRSVGAFIGAKQDARRGAGRPGFGMDSKRMGWDGLEWYCLGWDDYASMPTGKGKQLLRKLYSICVFFSAPARPLLLPFTSLLMASCIAWNANVYLQGLKVAGDEHTNFMVNSLIAPAIGIKGSKDS